MGMSLPYIKEPYKDRERNTKRKKKHIAGMKLGLRNRSINKGLKKGKITSSKPGRDLVQLESRAQQQSLVLGSQVDRIQGQIRLICSQIPLLLFS